MQLFENLRWSQRTVERTPHRPQGGDSGLLCAAEGGPWENGCSPPLLLCLEGPAMLFFLLRAHSAGEETKSLECRVGAKPRCD